MSGLSLGIDLGGTKIYAVVADENNRVLAAAKNSTPEKASARELALAMLATGKEALQSMGLDLKDTAHFGAAVPSPIDPVTGEALLAVNLAEKNFSLKSCFRELTGLEEVYLENDANMGLYSEYICGNAKGSQSAVGFWIGTGLGGSILLDGKILRGNGGLAGELGHMIIKKGGRKCSCGHKGCVEAYCSKKAFIKSIRKYMEKYQYTPLLPAEKFNESTTNIKSKYLLRAYEAGDQSVIHAVDKGAWALGIAGANMCAVLSPDTIILGGGVITSLGDHFLPIFRKSFQQHLFAANSSFVKVKSAANGDDSVALGAAIFARNRGEY